MTAGDVDDVTVAALLEAQRFQEGGNLLSMEHLQSGREVNCDRALCDNGRTPA
ncbi:MAG TPA: hypothetical protein GX400_12435 [Chloroflexi bacterium]|nr:hypothetical protein [Chloroflexota bacterium]